MLKKIARDFTILLCAVALWASTSRTAMQFVADHRDGKKWYDGYPCLHGDLVSLSYLDFAKPFIPPGGEQHIKKAVSPGPRNTVLVLQGDSHTWKLADSDFAGVCTYDHINRVNGGYYHIDTSKRNILVIEVSERYLRACFEDLQIFGNIHDTDEAAKKISFNYFTGRPVHLASFLPGIHLYFFNKFINQNLQCNLFNYNFIMPMFECKAALNYYLFNRASGDVVISNDRKFLFLKETVSTNDIGSSYSPVSNDEINRIVYVLNTIYDHYKKAGFNEVYFSVIPNSATIMQPGGYNNLIPRVQDAPGLRMKVIDIYTVFKNSPNLYFLPGDTHWNTAGKQLWVDLVNKKLLGE